MKEHSACGEGCNWKGQKLPIFSFNSPKHNSLKLTGETIVCKLELRWRGCDRHLLGQVFLTREQFTGLVVTMTFGISNKIQTHIRISQIRNSSQGVFFWKLILFECEHLLGSQLRTEDTQDRASPCSWELGMKIPSWKDGRKKISLCERTWSTQPQLGYFYPGSEYRTETDCESQGAWMAPRKRCPPDTTGLT